MGRDPLRAISQVGVFVLFYLLTITVLAMPLYWLGGQLVETTLTPFIGAISATYICCKIYDWTPLPQAGLTRDRRGGRDLALGIAAGIAGVAVALAPGLLFQLSH